MKYAAAPVLADYRNPVYVEMVAKGLRRTEHFDPVRHWVDSYGCLWFENGIGIRIAFSPLGRIPCPARPAAYVPGDELVDE